MKLDSQPLEQRVFVLERRLRRDRAIGAVALVALLALGAARSPAQTPSVQDVLRVRQLVVVDDEGRTRIVLGQDPKDTQRRSRGCGMILVDSKGSERFGVSTMDDMSVVLGMDAPRGVGSPMPDRIGLAVGADGAARIDLIDNRTMIPVRLVADASGTGGVEFFDYDVEKLKVTITRLDSSGEHKREESLGAGK